MKKMFLRYLTLNAAIVSWIIALILWLTRMDDYALAAMSTTALLLLCYFLRNKEFTVFGKPKNELKPINEPTIPAPAASAVQETEDKKQASTVIASDVTFEGNISATGIIYIHGKVLGNIDCPNGIIKIMRNGLVEGNILGREAIIDGSVIGECHADNLDIEKNGKIVGSISYQTVSIKRGGELSGHATQKPASRNNVIELMMEQNDECELLLTEEIVSNI